MIGSLVFLAAFAALVLGAAPGLALRDSGELSAAAFTLGVAHETGFALYCLAAKVAALFPVGEVATRLALFSSLCGALAALLVFRLVRSLGGRDAVAEAGGAAAAALLISGFTFYRASTVPEVYASTTAALALGLLLLDGAARGSRNAALALALVGGLSLGLHAHLRLLLGPPVAVWALLRLRRGDRWPLVAPILVAIGAGVVAYLPIRAAQSPAANWADPRTLSGLWHHLSAHHIRASFADEIFARDFFRVAARVRQFAALAEGQLGMPALLLGIAGVVWLCVRARVVGVALAFVLAGDLVYSTWVNPMGLEDLQDGAPTALALSIGLGVVATAAARKVRSGAVGALVAAAIGFIAVVPAALADLEGKRGLSREPAAWVRAALDDLPPRGAVLTTSDDLSAGTLYEQVVAGARPDVRVRVRQQLPESEVRAALHDGARWEPGNDEAPPVEPGAPLWRPLPAQPALPDPRPIAARLEQLLGSSRDPFVRQKLAWQLTALGRLYYKNNEIDRAAALFETALVVRPDDAPAATNLAVVLARRGDYERALDLLEKVLARDPTREVARKNAALYRERLHR